MAAILPSAPRARAADEPDAPATRQVKRYMDILLSPMNDDDAYKAIAEIEKTPSFTREVLPRFRADIHGMEPYGIVRASATEAEYVARDPRMSAWIHIVVTVEPDPPHRILSLRMTPAATPLASAG
jgi:hypothetical protein